MPSVLLIALLWLISPGRAAGQPFAPRLPPDTEASGLGMLRTGRQADPAQTDAAASPFQGDAAAVSDRNFLLLVQNGYHFDDDGRLYPLGAQSAVTQGEFPYALEDARSRARLKALLQLNVILSRNNYAKKLPAEDREAIRGLGRENWDLFSKSTRKDLRRFFSPAELEQLDEKLRRSDDQAPATTVLTQGPGAAEARGLTETTQEPMLKDIPLASIPEDLLDLTFSRPAVPSTPKPLSLPAPRARRPRKAAIKPAPQIQAPPPSAPPAALPAPWNEVPLPAPWSQAPTAAPAASTALASPAAAPNFSVSAAPLPPVAAVQGLDDSIAQLRPTKSAPLPVAPKPRSFADLPIFSVPGATAERTSLSAAAPSSSEYPEFKQENFRAFLESAPYGRGVKPLLQLLADHARDPERRIALGLVQLYLPHMILDSEKSGARIAALSRLPAEAGLPGRWQIALNDQPLFVRNRGLLLGKKVFLLPDSPDFYRTRALPPPSMRAFSREAASDHDKDDGWGRLRVYGDGSLRLRLSDEQLAGMLIKELIRLDSMLRGWDLDAYHAELRASAAQFKFYQDLAVETKKEPALDQDTLARYKSWLERPEEYASFVLQTISAPRQGAQDAPREEVRVLSESGVIDDATAQRTMESLPAAADKEGSLETWVKTSAGPSEAQAVWLGLEKQARRKP